ncbi:hypothetical protein [Cohnella zeiphila]|uniref:Uncharacterized protein n=1 Tax=Cohnella zeiphila TaxID=2761120 RepID=A0A7X0VWY4_9BACL|nr:hypothetical protein [Cohnella zeiphila]MBB6733719.1 hypothetical protein [Cohnella zeiphila]
MMATVEPLPFPDVESPLRSKISYMELFLLDRDPFVPVPRVVWLHLYCDGFSGWGRCEIPLMRKHLDLLQWASVFLSWREHPLAECLDQARVHGESWGAERRILAQSALLDLAERMAAPFRRRTSLMPEPRADELIDRSESYCYYALKLRR